MAIFGNALMRSKPTTAPEPAADDAAQARLASRLEQLDQMRRLKEFGVIRGVNRKHERAQAYRVATAMFFPGHQTTARIVNQSHSGLRLRFSADLDCPDEFALTIPTLRFIGVVRTVWRKGNEVGVSIVRWSDGA